MEGLEEALRLVARGPAAEGLGDEVREEAARLLRGLDARPPLPARRLEPAGLWAAAALHRAGMRLAVRPRATVKQLAARAGVRVEDLSEASLTIDVMDEVGHLLHGVKPPKPVALPRPGDPCPSCRSAWT